MISLFKKICISSDHAGFELKEYIKNFLINSKISITDLGPILKKSVDYPDYAKKVAKRVSKKKSEIGILVCGSDCMAISANKTKEIGHGGITKYTQLSRQHNNANILCLGSRLTKKKDIKKIVSAFLNTKFEGGRHKRRIKKI